MVAQIVTWGLAAYGTIGLLFGLAFILRGAGVLDPIARESSVGFRLMILPGAVGLWPWLLARWAGARRRGT